jgi:hypothetical protein
MSFSPEKQLRIFFFRGLSGEFETAACLYHQRRQVANENKKGMNGKIAQEDCLIGKCLLRRRISSALHAEFESS